MKVSALVTGVGAVIGQGIIKSLQAADLPVRIIGVDANPDAVGFAWTDAAYTVPMASSPGWADAMLEICGKESVDILMPGIEQDVKALLLNLERFGAEAKAFPMLNSAEALRVGFDKWDLRRFALEKGILTPETWLTKELTEADVASLEYPVLLKPRKGMASKGIYKAANSDEYHRWLACVEPDEYITQKYKGNDGEEYTVSVFGFKGGGLSRPFALRRKLNYGSTFEAETVQDSKLDGVALNIATRLKVAGPSNFQFRKEGGEYYLMEVNPRFSSSTSIKSIFGFNEPAMAIRSFVLGEPSAPLDLKKGKCFRYIADHARFE